MSNGTARMLTPSPRTLLYLRLAMVTIATVAFFVAALQLGTEGFETAATPAIIGTVMILLLVAIRGGD